MFEPFRDPRNNPQYNAAKLAKALSEFEIGYEHIAELGGLRSKNRDVPADVNAFWENQSFHNYADYAMSHEFRSGLARLRELGHGTTSAIMCAEAVWWRCHRRIITDYLITAGETVFHILGTQSRRASNSHSRGCTDSGWHVVLSERLLSQNKKVVAKR